MKTLIVTLVILALLSILFFLISGFVYKMKDCKFRRWFNREVVEFEETIEFEFIKLVSLTGRIRVFSLYGNHLADISEDGAIIYISSKSIGQEAEIRYILDNYEMVSKILESAHTIYPIGGNPICPNNRKGCNDQDMDGYTDCSKCNRR